MASLVGQRSAFGLSTGNDPDADHHGVGTPDGGLMKSNDYLVVALAYLMSHRPGWPAQPPREADTRAADAGPDHCHRARGRAHHRDPHRHRAPEHPSGD
jgi:hypothetical protein